MNCIICDSRTKFYFSKDYNNSPYSEIMGPNTLVEYHCCRRCGFVISKTHADMPLETWKKLNFDFHQYANRLKYEEKPSNSPPYTDQALMLALLAKGGVINTSKMLDYGGGTGILSDLLKDLFDIELLIYEPYIQNSNSNKYLRSQDLSIYSHVFNSAMFEHVLTRQSLDDVNDRVAPEGSLGIHTVVCEVIPKDPDWFYLVVPVHTAFHTNKSMQILMEQWGYKSSIYCFRAKSWIFLNDEGMTVERKVNQINSFIKSKRFLYKKGFLDYWK